jgi:ATP-binding cassette, subfamily B, bacterial
MHLSARHLGKRLALFKDDGQALTPIRRLLWRYLKPQWGKVLLLLALLLGSIALQLIAPQFVRAFLDAAQAGGGARELLPLAAVFLCRRP